MVGRRLGHYEIIRQLGSGGMGEVYLAEDTSLDRQVALKVLPSDLASDPERRQRFEREAKAIAALDHPNIVTVFSVEEADADEGGHVHFITMQLVEGKTLSELIPRSGFPLERFFDLAIPLADAISSAHEHGIVHRDLKPANIMVSDDGRVRVLDFGLAKLREEAAGFEGESELPTVGDMALLTEEGKILGTVAYMSPEQAEGKPVDHRTDIFSLGIILYEMATGERPFKGDTKVSVMSSILKETPTSVTALNRDFPRHLGRIVKRALAKDTEHRFQSTKDLRNDLEELKEEIVSGELVADTAAAAAAHPLWRRALPWSLAVVAVVACGVAAWSLIPPAEPPSRQLMRLALELPPAGLAESGASSVPIAALSPDGTLLAYVARAGNSTQLYLRFLDQLEASAIPGTEGASDPFFSFDGRWAGFTAAGKLKKVAVAGGPPVDICDRPQSRGADWGPDDTIYFTLAHGSGLWRVSASGGNPERVTILDTEKGENSHRWPHLLPGGKGVLFTIWAGGSFEAADIGVLSLETGNWWTLIDGGTYARYSPTGHIVYARAGLIMAAQFDLDRLEVTGPHLPVLEGVMVDRRAGAAQFGFSDSGTLVYLPSSRVVDGELVWVNRGGEVEPLLTPPGAYDGPRVSPDGNRIALTIRGSDDDVWIHEIARGTLTRFTYDPGIDETPLWSPDGARLAFASDRRGYQPSAFWRPSDGSSPKELLMARERHRHLDSWSPRDQALAYTEFDPETGEDVWLLPLDGDREPRPFLQTQSNESDAVFSPEGRWLAYVSDESGRDEVYVQTYPESSVKWQISTEGGMSPQWAKNGSELFYRTGDRLMAVEVETEPAFRAGNPRALFEGQFQYINVFRTNYDVAPDGRFLMIRPLGESAPTHLNVVLNWFEELKRLVPAGR